MPALAVFRIDPSIEHCIDHHSHHPKPHPHRHLSILLKRFPSCLLRYYIMPYWSKGKLGIREGDYLGTQKFHLGSQRSMAFNILTANAVVP